MAVTDTGGHPVGGRASRNVAGDHRSGTDESVGAAGLVGAATFGLPSAGRSRTLADPGAGLEDMLYHSTANAEPVPLAALRTAVTKVRADFQNARYDRMGASLPALIATATATATRDHADDHERATASTLLADAYITAASFMVKLNDDPLAWTTADRALQAAGAGDDPLTLAEARRAVATVLRRTGRPAQARDLLLSAASAIEPGHRPTPGQLSMYGYRALLSAERAAPAEVSYRPPVHRMTKDLLRADRSLPGLRTFAHRIGVPDA